MFWIRSSSKNLRCGADPLVRDGPHCELYGELLIQDAKRG